MSVVVPFSGSQGEADELCRGLAGLALDERDEVVLVDNSPAPLQELDGPVHRVRAIEERCSYYARNVGLVATRNDWVLFLDGDCRPQSGDMLDRLFEPPPGDRCGGVAGGVVDAVGQSSLLARHARSRRYLDQRGALSRPRPFALTANLMVRRSAWEAVGGFCETIRSGGDQDFSWRLRDAGWSLELRDDAAVGHVHQERLRPAMRKFVRYGAGAAWLARRHPGGASLRPPLMAGLGRAVAGALVWTLLGRRERAAFKVIDGAVIVAMNVGYLLENRPPSPPAAAPSTAGGHVVLADEAPSPALDGVLAGARLVEVLRRAREPHAEALRCVPVAFSEDDGHGRRLLDLGWLALRRPRALAAEAARDLRSGMGGPSVRDVACIARRLQRSGAAPQLVVRGSHARATADRLGPLAGATPAARSVPSEPLGSGV